MASLLIAPPGIDREKARRDEKRLIEKIQGKTLSREEIHEQRMSWVRGNIPLDETPPSDEEVEQAVSGTFPLQNSK